MLNALRARLIDDLRYAHRLWSVRGQLFWAAVNALYAVWPAFQSEISLTLFASASVAMGLALTMARLVRQDAARPMPPTERTEPSIVPAASDAPAAPEPAPAPEPLPQPEPAPEPVPLPTTDPRPRVGGKKKAYVAVCVGFLACWEGYEPVAKHEAIDPPGVITACFGMTNYDRQIAVGQRFTKEQCEQYLAEDLPRYEAGVRKCIPGFDDMPPSRQASLVSFGYNLGPAALCKSRVALNLNAGRVAAGCDDMLLYVYANHNYIKGLDNRRHAERALCLKDK